jgi:hypothetical protein
LDRIDIRHDQGLFIAAQNNQRQPIVRSVLLVANALIGRDHGLKPSFVRSLE